MPMQRYRGYIFCVTLNNPWQEEAAGELQKPDTMK